MVFPQLSFARASFLFSGIYYLNAETAELIIKITGWGFFLVLFIRLVFYNSGLLPVHIVCVSVAANGLFA